MGTKNQKQNGVQTLFILAVFATFAVLAALLTLTGAKVYKGVTESTQANHALRASLSYVANRIHACTERETVSVGQYQNTSILTIEESVEGHSYYTRIYFYGGALREHTSVDSDVGSFAMENGDAIAMLQDFQVQQDESRITIMATDETGQTRSMMINLDQ